ncbi:MAG: VWA domain-containing protein [Planctomycetes bacterium]|nr:VWA domain-containing protein [Planctomycetota bacterium]
MGFINLIAFGYLSLCGFVVLLYYFSKKKSVVEVPSMLPWMVLKEDIVRSRVFRADILFLLQLLLILLLVFFLARPYLKSSISNISGKNVVLLIDLSASMQTSEANGSRFDQAKSDALRMVSKLGQGDRMMVLTADSSSRILTEFTNDRQVLNTVIENLRPRDTGTNLEEGVSLGVSFLKNVDKGEMHVLTDQSPSTIGFSQTEGLSVKFTRYGANTDNVAITSLDIYQDMFNNYTEREAYVTVKNYSEGTKDVTVQILLRGDVIKKTEIVLSGGEQKTLRVGNLHVPGIVKAEIETNDFLSVDNAAYAIVNKIKPVRILLVSDDSKLENELEKVQNSTHRIRLTRIETADYVHDLMGNYDVTIFHRFMPDINPDISALYVSPHESRSYLESKVKGVFDPFHRSLINVMRVSNNARIIDWDSTHPIMRHLDHLDNIHIKSVVEIKPPEWSTSLIKIAGTSMDATVAFAGEYKGERTMVFGFDLGSFDFSEAKNLKILIMILNIIQWLNPYEKEESISVLTGDQYHANYIKQGEFELLNPKGETEIFPLVKNAEEREGLNKVEYVGVYRISGAHIQREFVANLFNEKESDLLAETSATKEFSFEESESVTIIEDKKNEFGRYLLMFVPLLLLLEWVIYYKKVRSGTA